MIFVNSNNWLEKRRLKVKESSDNSTEEAASADDFYFLSFILSIFWLFICELCRELNFQEAKKATDCVHFNNSMRWEIMSFLWSKGSSRGRRRTTNITTLFKPATLDWDAFSLSLSHFLKIYIGRQTYSLSSSLFLSNKRFLVDNSTLLWNILVAENSTQTSNNRKYTKFFIS